MDYLSELNAEQYRAVNSSAHAVLVLAGAGTGKTKTLSARIAYLVKEKQVLPSEILALTFTNKAAKEMWERTEKILGKTLLEGFSPFAKTFHSLGVQILREQHHILKIPKYFKILDADDKKSLIKQAMKKEGIDTKEWEPRKIASFISRMKGEGKDFSFLEKSKNNFHFIVKLVWKEYEMLKQEERAFDFDDLIFKTYFLLKENRDILSFYQKRWKHILIDEYQDTNYLQYKIIKLLATKDQYIFAVGDGDQNIYSWRGADMRNILNFEKDFPGAEMILLEENYRSTKNILDASHAIISKNKARIEKTLRSQKEAGEKIIFYEAFSAQQEAAWITKKIQEYQKQGVKLRDIAVLFRTNFQSRILEEAFLRAGIPYTILGVKFFSRKEIKDLLAYLRASLESSSLSDLKRIMNEPKRGIGKVSLVKIFAGKTDEMSPKAKLAYQKFQEILADIRKEIEKERTHPSRIIQYIIERSGFKEVLQKGSTDDLERLENMYELVSYAQKYDGVEDALEKFLEEVALLSDQDTLVNDASKEKVRLMTIHASKGLEFSHVFLSGLEQGLFPVERNEYQTREEAEEERRLCYVAFTRAKNILHLSYARRRMVYGQERLNEASEFILDIPDDLILPDEESFSFRTEASGESFYIDDEGKERRSYLDF